MSSSKPSSGLSVGYRIGYRIRMFALTIFGPAQLGDGNDPKARLERERAGRVARAQAAAAEHGE